MPATTSSVFILPELKYDICSGVSNLFMEDYPNCPAVVGGILAEECAAALQRFFSELRTGE